MLSRGLPGSKVCVAALLVIFLLLCSTIALKKSNTWDEPAHILAGHAYLAEGMDYLSPLNHPVTGRMLTALLPFAILDLDFDPTVRPERAEGSNFFPYSLKFLYENRVEGRSILFLSRLANILLAAALALSVYLWSKEAWGTRGGLLSLFLYILSPNILAHSSLATTDLPVTAFFFISVFGLYRLSTHGVSLTRVILPAVFIALALTSKHTALLILPVLAASFVISLWREPARKVISGYLLLLLLVYTGIWCVYGLRYLSPSTNYEPLLWESLYDGRLTPLFDLLRGARLLPEAYLYSLAGVLQGASTGRAAFLMGGFSNTGWWYYFPLAFLIKTPVATIIFLVAGIFYLFTADMVDRRKALYMILPALLVFIALSFQKVNIGLRHVLPVYPFIFTLIGFVPNIKTRSLKPAKAVFYAVCLWYLYAVVSIYPHQLAYFNEFVGGPANGYKYLVDSNLDWGQDLAGLKEYIDEKGIERIKLAYFGFSDPGYYGIEYEYLPSYLIPEPQNVMETVPVEGWFAISATLLQGLYLPDPGTYQLFREVRPVDTIGHSIFIYKF